MSHPGAPADVAVPHAPVGAAAARRWLTRQLRAWGVRPEVVDDAALIVTELVGNAVVHGGPDERGCVRVCCATTPDGVRIEVTDRGGTGRSPRVRHQPDVALTGRGLRLVAALARDWGTQRDESGVTVWALLAA